MPSPSLPGAPAGAIPSTRPSQAGSRTTSLPASGLSLSNTRLRSNMVALEDPERLNASTQGVRAQRVPDAGTPTKLDPTLPGTRHSTDPLDFLRREREGPSSATTTQRTSLSSASLDTDLFDEAMTKPFGKMPPIDTGKHNDDEPRVYGGPPAEPAALSEIARQLQQLEQRLANSLAAEVAKLQQQLDEAIERIFEEMIPSLSDEKDIFVKNFDRGENEAGGEGASFNGAAMDGATMKYKAIKPKDNGVAIAPIDISTPETTQNKHYARWRRKRKAAEAERELAERRAARRRRRLARRIDEDYVLPASQLADLEQAVAQVTGFEDSLGYISEY